MKLGLQLPNFSLPGGPSRLRPWLLEVIRLADQAGFASFWVMDHFFQMEVLGGPNLDMLESYTTLGFAAAASERLRLGAMVTGVTYRHPGLLAKIVSTLDVLSGGRAMLGLGAAWYEREHRGLGVPFPPVKERFERLEETLQIVLQMWSGEVKPYHGRHYQLAETLDLPAPLSRPHPPILIGGGGERKTLRLVAQYADACNLFPGPELARKLEVLRRHCQELGRDYASIEKTVMSGFNVSASGGDGSDSPEQVLETLSKLAQAGVQQVIVSLRDPSSLDSLRLIAERVLPHAAKISA